MEKYPASYAYTKEEYDRFVNENGRTPTQDPMYNHSAGNPNKRPVPIIKLPHLGPDVLTVSRPGEAGTES